MKFQDLSNFLNLLNPTCAMGSQKTTKALTVLFVTHAYIWMNLLAMTTCQCQHMAIIIKVIHQISNVNLCFVFFKMFFSITVIINWCSCNAIFVRCCKSNNKQLYIVVGY